MNSDQADYMALNKDLIEPLLETGNLLQKLRLALIILFH